MSDHQQLVARNIKRFRAERGLTMSELARSAGLSKQTLSTIEAGGGNPTVDTLALLARALDVSMRRLLTEWGTPVFVQRRDDAEWVDHQIWTERLMSEVYGSGYIRTLLTRLERTSEKPGVVDSHVPGTLHHLYVVTGRVRVGPVREPVDLGPGDFARYPADVPHVLAALTERATAVIVSSEPQLRQTRPGSR
ncbi:XRE family transcriptional regulator [Nocardioides sp.]|uniref:helix-turn-helix domain-containing protein n=1 Tax=Nocardioides sp. TaxID=35761 RepID=UPI00262657DA|nr:XRE family transcriptional regulator [Nocardioides sp.]